MAMFSDGMDEGSELSTPVPAEARGDGDSLLSPTGQAPPGIPAEGEKKERKKRTTIGLGMCILVYFFKKSVHLTLFDK